MPMSSALDERWATVASGSLIRGPNGRIEDSEWGSAMPAQPSHPGVYIQEMASGVRSIVGASTSAAAFVDVFERGPVDHPVRVSSMSEFDHIFGGLDERSEASYGASQFFLNGGATAWIVRLDPDGATTSAIALHGLDFEASSPGVWGDSIQVAVTEESDQKTNEKTLSVAVHETGRHGDQDIIVRSEFYPQLSLDSGPRRLSDVINHESELVRVGLATENAARSKSNQRENPQSGKRPFRASHVNNLGADASKKPNDADDGNNAPKSDDNPFVFVSLTGGDDGLGNDRAAALEVVKELMSKPDDGTGMYALRNMAPEIFNLLCLPATAFMATDDRTEILTNAATFCELHRAFFVVDSPVDIEPDDFEEQVAEQLDNLSANAAVWYPTLVIPDPINNDRPRDVASSGTMAGVIARTDTERGVWKAPAGADAMLRGAKPQFGMTDTQNSALNELGFNCLRSFPIYGDISWGARTLKGADASASEWKYVPVRRTALHIENSVFAGTEWAVFEPNDEPLWAQLRLSVGTFMHDLYQQGAFAGEAASDAYFVRCDRTTTTQSDIDNGIVNIMVGFAPLKPAEFVIVNIEQIART